MLRNVFLLLFIAGSCYAQDSTQFDKLIPRTAIKFAPLTLANFYPTVELSIEQKIAKRFSVQAGYGYVLNYQTNNDPEYQNKRGYKIKLEIRYYLLPSERAGMSYYVATGYYMNRVDFDRNAQRQECYDLSCSSTFTRYFTYVVNYREQGFTLKFGFLKHFSKSVFMDVNGGWSLRFINYDEPPLPGFNNFGNDVSFFLSDFPNEEDRVGLMPMLGARICYRFR
ncbi:MAG TPA: hypothetical protein PLJ60_06250 [Chryseolinea sp.]|nr:hypothetical protein [Chryseolinea sp.]HPM29919.1 hypothetical protein [Chryseolinea sp.]